MTIKAELSMGRETEMRLDIEGSIMSRSGETSMDLRIH